MKTLFHEERGTILQNKVPLERSRLIYNKKYGRALCDLGSSINLMTLSIYQKLGIGEARSTKVTFQLVDRSFTHLEGKSMEL